MDTTESFVTRRRGAQRVREELGIPCGDSTVDKECALARGPKPDAYAGRVELFTWPNFRDWALGRLRRPTPTAA